MNKKTIWILTGTSAAALGAGWILRGMMPVQGGGAPEMAMQMPPPAVTVQAVEQSLLRPDDEYIARVEPVEEVRIRSEVSGYVAEVHFTEGSMVNAGDLLFTIDRRSYQATADAAEAELFRAQKLYDRMKTADARSVSRSDLETAESGLLRARADFNLAQVSLDYTEIKAPVGGRIGAAKVTKGNYVTSASGDLAHIVRLDPVRVVFSMTDREYFAVRRQEIAGSGGVRVAQIRMPDGTVLPITGKKDFDDNVIHPQTGTIAVRYLFDNRDGLLLPGAVVTALLHDPEGEKGLKIPQRALLLDQQGMYVLTVDEKNTAAAVRITVGRQIGPDITVLSGLSPGDRVMTEGLQKVRPGMTVTLKQAEARP